MLRAAALTLLATLLALAAPAQAQRRTALVVGIGEYQNLPPVVRSAGDAEAVRETLQRLGFEADLVLEPAAADFDAAVARFVQDLQPEDTALVYFSGHSTGWPGDYILLPKDAPAQGASQEDIRRVGGVGLHVLAEQIRAAGARAQVLIVDACRGDPYAGSGGDLAPSTCGNAGRQMPEGTFVLFSASSGQKALDRLGDADQDPHSLFTRTLLRRLPEVRSAVRLGRVVRTEVAEIAASVSYEQRPAYLDELVGAPGILNPRERETAAAPAPNPPPEPLPREAPPRHSEPLPEAQPQQRAEPLPEPRPQGRADAFQCAAFDPGPPAFDCRSAASAVEIAICRDPRLGSCDRLLNEVFERAQARAGRRAAALRREEDAWLAMRDACAREGRAGPEALAVCVGEAYDQRIAELDGAPAVTGATNPDPSFDCRYARTRVEQAICADPGLAAQDREMAALYAEVLARIPGRARAVEGSQNAWRADRDRCARSREVERCVEAAYADRIEDLRSVLAQR